MALGRGKDTLPFQLAVQEETNPPKREVSSGQEALLTPSAGVPSCPPPTSPKQSPHPTRNFQIFRSPGLHQSSLNPFQTSSSPPSRLTRFLPHTHTEASSNLDQPKHTPRLPKQRHRPATLGGSSSPPPTGSSPLSPRAGGRGPRSASLRPGASPQPGRGRALTHPPGGRSRPGANPKSRRGVCYGPRGRGCRKSQLQLPGCQARCPPPQPTRPIGPRAQPRPVGAPRKPRPHRAPGAGAAPSHSTCARDAALGRS